MSPDLSHGIIAHLLPETKKEPKTVKKGRNSGHKDEEGQRLWEHVTRSVTAYARGEKPAKPASAPSFRPAKTVRGAYPPPSEPPVPAAARPALGFDAATESRLRKGKLSLEGRLDLHGLTQVEAHAALRRFIHAAVDHEKRTVLVITGKGSLSGGVLRRMLPLWIEADGFLSRHVLALSPAQPKDGGAGAFYIRLRKPSPS